MLPRYPLIWLSFICSLMACTECVCIQLLYSKAGEKDLTYKTISGSVLFECKALCEMSTPCTSFTLDVSDRVCRLNTNTSKAEEEKDRISQNQNGDRFFVCMEKTAALVCPSRNSIVDGDIDLVLRKACTKEPTRKERPPHSQLKNKEINGQSKGRTGAKDEGDKSATCTVSDVTSKCYTFTGNVNQVPLNGIIYGQQNNGGEDHWSAIAHTEHGPVPGKAHPGKFCYYAFQGSELETKNFSFITAPPGKIVPVINTGSPPAGAVSVGSKKNEDGDYYAVVTVSPHGLIPGKAKGNKCWYSFCGRVYSTRDFMWLVCLDKITQTKEGNTTPEAKDTNKRQMAKKKGLVSKCYTYTKNHKHAPPKTIGYGWQNDGSGHYLSAVAKTKHGLVAGKAKDNGSCWYTFHGSELQTENYFWITAPQRKIVPVINTGSPPPGAVNVGPLKNEDGDYYVAVAITRHGLIPGNAKGNICWYGYAGREYQTKDFLWIVCQGKQGF